MSDKNIIQKDGEHPFAKYVRVLGKGKKGSRSLTDSEAYDAMSMILNDEVKDLQLGAFLMLLRVKEETAEELSGFVKAVKDYIQAPTDIYVDLDWSSYAGKRRHSPWFILSVLLLTRAGYKIFMHGASGHTANRVYTEDVLRELSLGVCNDWDSVRSSIDKTNFAYMPLSGFSQRLADIINMRDTLGLRSPVHSLSRLINPLNSKVVLQGIFHPPYSFLHQEAGNLLGYPHVAVIKGEGGEIERNPDTSTVVKSSHEGEFMEEEWPAMFDKRHVKSQDMSADYMKTIWHGTQEDEYAVAAIISTAALALKSLDSSHSQESALNKATRLWEERDKSAL